MATIDDVARDARVSKGTVSNVFTKKRPVSPEVTRRVLDVAKRLDFRPNYVARTLATKKTHIIGLNMYAEKIKFSQFHLSMINGVLRRCHDLGYRLLINTTYTSSYESVEHMTSDPVDGEILLDPSVDDPRLRSSIQRGVPVVVVGRPPADMQRVVSYVDNDNVETARDVTTYLIKLGHRKITFLNNEQVRTVAEDRARGFRQAFYENDIKLDESFIYFKEPIQTSVDFGYDTLCSLVEQGKIPSAVITDTDKMALGVYRAAVKLGLRIPRDISVFAFSDDSIFSPELQPPLSGVRLNAEDLGVEAVNMLIEKISEGTKRVKKVYVPSELVIRESCAVHDVNINR